jgi:ribonuclease HIII
MPQKPADGTSKPPALHSYTAALTPEQAEKLRVYALENGFKMETKPYAIFAARKDKLAFVVYEKGPKVVLQGRGLEDFITFVLEPEILGQATFGYEEELHAERFAPHFGIDESGKGDFFGPLIVAGVYVDADIARRFRELGITDSKRITTDARIRNLAAEIKRSRTPQKVLVMAPARYNELIVKMRNVNRLLAWGHARVIEDLLDLQPDCPGALSDQFAHASVLQRALLEKGRRIELRQQTKAESDPAVAAASILAREKLIDWFEEAALREGEKQPFPRGASAQVKSRAIELVRQHGPDILPRVAKTHFKTAGEVLAAAGHGALFSD